MPAFPVSDKSLHLPHTPHGCLPHTALYLALLTLVPHCQEEDGHSVSAFLSALGVSWANGLAYRSLPPQW